MSINNNNVPIHVTSEDEDPKTPSSAHSTTRSPIPAISPTPTPPASFQEPPPQPHPLAPSPTQAGPSRWRQHLRAKGTTHKRTARMRVKPPSLHLADIERFSWVHDTLDQWRTDEGLKGVLDGNLTPPYSPNLPITREPVEHTIPPLVLRTDRHERTIRELQERVRQLEGYLRVRVEPRAAGLESRVVRNTQSLAMMRVRMETIETENPHLREDLQELADTVKAMEEYNDITEQRLKVIENGYANIQTLADTLTRVINALRQVQPPPPPPQQ